MHRIPEKLLEPEVIGPLFVTPAFFMTVLASIGIVLWFRGRSERARHDMLRLLLEKGHPVPPELFASKRRPGSDLRRGVTLLTGGLGLALALVIAGQLRAVGFALIPALVGIGFLVVYQLDEKRGKKDAPANGPLVEHSDGGA